MERDFLLLSSSSSILSNRKGNVVQYAMVTAAPSSLPWKYREGSVKLLSTTFIKVVILYV